MIAMPQEQKCLLLFLWDFDSNTDNTVQQHPSTATTTTITTSNTKKFVISNYKSHTSKPRLPSSSSAIMNGLRRFHYDYSLRQLWIMFQLSLLLLLLMPQSNIVVHCLRITLLDIPSPLVVGESAELTCNYDLEDNVLYSFKWYKDGIEFYRYVPRDYPPTQYLKMSGINVDIRKSSKKSVFLTNVNLSTRGKYRCEISAEAPSFVTAAKEGNLEINVLPESGPKITTDQNEYTVGNEIIANCTSDRSNLDIILNFTINGEPITSSFGYEVKYSTQLHSNSLKTSGLSLRFLLTEKHFLQGKLKLKCIASIPLYKMQNEANKVIKDSQYKQQEYLQYFASSSESQARSNVRGLDRHQGLNQQLQTKTEMNIVKFCYIIFTTIVHWQIQNFFH